MTIELIDTLRKIFEYDFWAVRASLETVRSCDHKRAAHLMAHIALAQKIWLLRLKGEDSSEVAPFQDLSLEEAVAEVIDTQKELNEYLSTLTGAELAAPITYRNTKGTEFTTPVHDILLHIAFHGAYHRGQVARLIREAGGSAVNTDYISFTRL